MNTSPVDENPLRSFGPYSLIIGVLLIALGTLGVFVPGLASLGTALFFSWLLIFGGVLWAIHTFRYDSKSVMAWLKPVLLLVVGGLMLVYPVTGVATLGLLLAIYLLMDAFSSFALAQSIHPAKGWGWMAFNGVISALLAAMFLIGWPATSIWLVGLYVSISLIFDGWSLVTIGWVMRKGSKT
ncbi:MAG TPA: hypothetical protein ENK38_04730 [Gammaproteobacteria bacterium]|nr:hypothetical protein [Gammaproteobacteria bacterium]